MNSSVIGKIEKAGRYAQERERIKFASFEVEFQGENGDHRAGFGASGWHCSCDFFASGYGACAHTMTLERVLESMLPAAASSAHLVEPAQA